jgi:transporter family protein
MKSLPVWLLFSLGSAFFAGLTAILGKLGVAVLGEPLTWRLVAGGVLIVAGALVIASG